MTKQNFTNVLFWVAAVSVGLVTGLSFVLSYQALWNVASDGGKPWPLDMAWPFIIDLPIVCFSAVALYAVSQGKWPWVFRTLVLAVTAWTVVFNVSYARGSGHDPFVYGVAPVMYFVSFEVLIWLIQAHSEHSILDNTLGAIKAELDNRRQELASIGDRIAAALEEGRTRLAQMEQETAAALDTGQTRVGDIERQIAAALDKLGDVERQIADKQETLNSQPVSLFVPKGVAVETRRELLVDIVRAGFEDREIAQAFDVSVKTIQRDRQALNGALAQ
jgi:hypothetical protein